MLQKHYSDWGMGAFSLSGRKPQEATEDTSVLITSEGSGFSCLYLICGWNSRQRGICILKPLHRIPPSKISFRRLVANPFKIAVCLRTSSYTCEPNKVDYLLDSLPQRTISAWTSPKDHLLTRFQAAWRRALRWGQNCLWYPLSQGESFASAIYLWLSFTIATLLWPWCDKTVQLKFIVEPAAT